MKLLKVFVLLGCVVFAETLVPVMDLVKLADQNSLQIQIAQNKLGVAQAQTDQAWSTIWPKLTLTGGYNRMDSYSLRSLGAPSLMDAYTEKLQLNQILWNGSALTAIGVSDYGLVAAQAQYNAAKEDTYLGILNLAFSIIQTQKNLDVLIESKKQLQGLYDKVVELQKNGLATRIDVLRTKANLAGLNVSIIDLRNAIEGQYNTLEMLVNAPLPSRSVDGQIIETLYKNFPVPSKVEVSTVLEKRYDYVQLKNTVKLMDANVDIARWSGLPSVMFVGSYGYQGTTGFNFNDSNRDWLLGVNASWSFMDFGTTEGKVKETDNTAAQMRKQLEQLKRSIANDLDSLQLSLKATYDKIDAISEEVQANADAYELMNSRYVLGEVTNLELLDAHTQLLTAKKKLVEAKIEYAGLALKWMKANGTLIPYIKKEAGL